ncbi:MAG: hypothetical protein HZC37_26270 [Burkholderiales bacterium]|nr:hypothetical protein [Burkholderiales bacterium]
MSGGTRRGRCGAGLAAVAAVTALTALTAGALAGCVVVPVTRDVYDPDCRLMRREVTLEAAVLGQFHSCSGQECAALLATLGVVSAATLVVSGSLAVVGNAVYWLEHEANCRRRNAPAAPAPPAAPGTKLDPPATPGPAVPAGPTGTGAAT